MATFDFSIDQIFRQAFGFARGGRYDGAQIDQSAGAAVSYEAPSGVPQEGTEFLTVRNALNAKLADGRALFMPVAIGGVVLPNEPTLYLSKRKRIVKTTLVGSRRRGSVKELISSEDWEIEIRGICVNTESLEFYPEDQVAAINELDAREEALEIECALTSLLGIYRIVIEQIRFPEMIGMQHAQAYELKCVSDEDFILEID